MIMVIHPHQGVDQICFRMSRRDVECVMGAVVSDDHGRGSFCNRLASNAARSDVNHASLLLDHSVNPHEEQLHFGGYGVPA